MDLYPLEAVSTTTLALNLVVEDLVLYSTGDRVPADDRITKAVYFSIDESISQGRMGLPRSRSIRWNGCLSHGIQLSPVTLYYQHRNLQQPELCVLTLGWVSERTLLLWTLWSAQGTD